MKRLSIVVLIVLLAFGVVVGGCGDDATDTTKATETAGSAETGEVIELLYANSVRENDLGMPAVKAWLTELEKRSNGRIRIEYSWGGSLGKAADYGDMLASNVFQLGTMRFHNYTGVYPLMTLALLPWSFDSAVPASKAMWKVMQQGFMDKELEASKVHVLWVGVPSCDPTFSGRKTLDSVADLKGMKMKVPSVARTRMSDIGAVPVTISSTELYMAMNKKTVDGYVAPWETVEQFMLDEVSEYCMEPGFGSVVHDLSINQETWDSLPADIQQLMTDMADLGVQLFGEELDRAAQSGKDYAIGKGMTIGTWSAADIETLSKAWAPVWDQWIADGNSKGEQAQEAIEVFYQALLDEGVPEPFAVGYTRK